MKNLGKGVEVRAHYPNNQFLSYNKEPLSVTNFIFKTFTWFKPYNGYKKALTNSKTNFIFLTYFVKENTWVANTLSKSIEGDFAICFICNTFLNGVYEN